MSAPILEENKYSVAIAEYATGHIRKKDLTAYRNGEPESEIYQVFDSKDEAENYVFEFIKLCPEFECVIFKSNGQHFKTYDLNGERRWS